MSHFMSRIKKSPILVPLITFILGIFVQAWFDQLISTRSLASLSTALIMLSLVIIFIALRQLDRRFDNIGNELIDIKNRTGLEAKYIADGLDGQSYKASTKLVKNAKNSLIFVGWWEPFPKYESSNTDLMTGKSTVIDARREFYNEVVMQVKHHQNDNEPFHLRIVQTPREYDCQPMPFDRDPVFFDYLVFIANVQSQSPSSCILKRITASINLHFVIIDKRHIIIPVLTHLKNALQARHGALFIDDTTQDKILVNWLLSIYHQLANDALAYTIKPDDLKPE